MATITGTAVSPSGQPLTSGTLTFEPTPYGIVAAGDDTVFPIVVSTTIGDAGAISFELEEGSYQASFQRASSAPVFTFPFVVPAGATADFNDCLVGA